MKREAPSPTSRGSQHSSRPTSTANAARSDDGHCSEPKSTGKSHDRRAAPLEPQETIGRRAPRVGWGLLRVHELRRGHVDMVTGTFVDAVRPELRLRVQLVPCCIDDEAFVIWPVGLGLASR